MQTRSDRERSLFRAGETTDNVQVRLRAVLAALGLSASCSPPTLVDLSSRFAPTDLLVLAATDASGALRETALRRPGEAATKVTLGAEERLHVFAIPPEAFVDNLGEPLRESDWSAVELRRDGATPGVGSCGRCLVASGHLPHPVYPGDSCPPPKTIQPRAFERSSDAEWDEVEVAASEREEVRLALRLDWPGDCPCFPQDVADAPPAQLEWLGLGPGQNIEDVLPAVRFAQAPSGKILLFAGERLEVVDPEQQTTKSRPWREVVPEGTLPVFAMGLPGDRFLIGIKPLESPDASLAILDGELSRSTSELMLAGDVGWARLRAFDGGRAYIWVRRGTDPFRLLACQVDPAIACVEALSTDLNITDPRGLRILPGGDLVALDGTRLITSIQGGQTSTFALGPPFTTRSSSGETATVTDVLDLGHLGRRLLLGAVATSSETVVLTTELGPNGGMISAPQLVYRARLARAGFAAVTETSTRVRAYFQPWVERAGEATYGSAYVDFDARGAPLTPSRPIMGGQLESASCVMHHLGAVGHEVALTYGGSVFARGGAQQQFVRIRGRELLPAPWVAGALAARNGEFWAFPGERAESPPPPIDPRTDLRLLPPGTLGASDIVTAAVYDHAQDAFILAGQTCVGQCRTWLRRVVPTGASTDIALPESITQQPCSHVGPPCRIKDIAEIDRERSRFAMIVENEPRIFLLDGEILSPVEIDWDDPQTLELETRPSDGKLCGARNSRDLDYEATGALLDLDAAFGTAFAVGCDGSFLRIEPWARPAVASRLSVARAGPDLLGALTINSNNTGAPSQLSAVRALCADHAAVGAPVPSSSSTRFDQGLGFVLELRADAESDLPDQLVIRKHLAHTGPGEQGNVGRGVGVLGDGRSLTAIFWNDRPYSAVIRRIGTTSPVRVGLEPLMAVEDEQGRILIAFSSAFFALDARR